MIVRESLYKAMDEIVDDLIGTGRIHPGEEPEGRGIPGDRHRAADRIPGPALAVLHRPGLPDRVPENEKRASRSKCGTSIRPPALSEVCGSPMPAAS